MTPAELRERLAPILDNWETPETDDVVKLFAQYLRERYADDRNMPATHNALCTVANELEAI